MDTKKEIRKMVFKRRAEHTDDEIQTLSHSVYKRVCEQPEFKNADRILVYADYNHEVMTGEMIKEAWKQGKEVAVPKVVGKDMVFYKLTTFSQLEPGYFQIPEPVSGEIVEWEDALMIMPGVAFTKNLERVGYGGGFYDRYLEKHQNVIRLAIAFEFQMAAEVPTEPTDINPQLLVTEAAVYRNAAEEVKK
ncbi:MAG: 5-formyltetrahydrofolate cyclo-ligase [Eubacteriales bacterium]|nr:5-formyltetrahydrofolate cyclo-ligase [Eubacteriales bacterium]